MLPMYKTFSIVGLLLGRGEHHNEALQDLNELKTRIEDNFNKLEILSQHSKFETFILSMASYVTIRKKL